MQFTTEAQDAGMCIAAKRADTVREKDKITHSLYEYATGSKVDWQIIWNHNYLTLPLKFSSGLS